MQVERLKGQTLVAVPNKDADGLQRCFADVAGCSKPLQQLDCQLRLAKKIGKQDGKAEGDMFV